MVTGLLVLAALAAVLAPAGRCALAIPRATMRDLFTPRWIRADQRQRDPGRDRAVPGWLRRMLLAAYRRRCLNCGSRDHLQADHIVPYAAGGLMVFWNLAILCRRCNQVKGYYQEWPSGRVSYIPMPGYTPRHVAAAAAITAREREARCNPLRWWLAGWAR